MEKNLTKEKHGRVRSEFCGICGWNFIEEGSRNTNIEREILGKIKEYEISKQRESQFYPLFD